MVAPTIKTQPKQMRRI